MQAVWAHWNELPDREQQLLLMRFYGNMTQAEIGAQLGISQMHVSRLLAEALSYLREHLVERDGVSRVTAPGGCLAAKGSPDEDRDRPDVVAIGAILAFAVTAQPSFFSFHVAGWVLMLTGAGGRGSAAPRLWLAAPPPGAEHRRRSARRSTSGGRTSHGCWSRVA